MLRPESLSTLSMQTQRLETLQRAQASLVKAEKEQSTGRIYDAGLELGYQVSRNLDWHSEISQVGSLVTRNKLAGVKAGVAQTGLDNLRSVVQSLVSTLTSAQSATNGRELAQTQAEAAWNTLTGVLGSTYQGQYIFSGINSDQAPLEDYAGSTGEADVANAFLTQFGFAQNNAATNAITASDLETFLNGNFDSLFDNANWQANWSNASDETLNTRSADNQILNGSVTANADAFRKVAKGIAMVMDLAKGPLNDDAFNTLATNAMKVLSEGMDGVAAEQSRIGLVQQALTQTEDRLTAKQTYLTTAVNATEGVDQTEVAIRLNGLMNQLEASYAITSRLNNLSLLNYLD